MVREPGLTKGLGVLAGLLTIYCLMDLFVYSLSCQDSQLPTDQAPKAIRTVALLDSLVLHNRKMVTPNNKISKPPRPFWMWHLIKDSGETKQMIKVNQKRRTAVILSGGGARGAYQIGVLKALRSKRVEPDIYCGTSVGAFNAAMLVSGRSLDEVESLWRSLRQKDVFEFRLDPRKLFTLNPQAPLDLMIESGRSFLDFLNGVLQSDGAWWQALDLDSLLFSSHPLETLIRNEVNIDSIRRSERQLFVALTRLKPTKESPLVVVDNQSVSTEHIFASCALPLIFAPVSLEEGVYCDGGVVMNTPLKLAIDAGAEEIYVIDLTPPPRTFRGATLPLAYQTMSACFAETLRRDMAVARDRNAEYLAAHKEGRLQDGKLKVGKLKEVEGELVEKVSSYSYIHIYEFTPNPDPSGLEAFLDFNPEKASGLIEEGEREGLERLNRYRRVQIQDKTGALFEVRALQP